MRDSIITGTAYTGKLLVHMHKLWPCPSSKWFPITRHIVFRSLPVLGCEQHLSYHHGDDGSIRNVLLFQDQIVPRPVHHPLNAPLHSGHVQGPPKSEHQASHTEDHLHDLDMHTPLNMLPGSLGYQDVLKLHCLTLAVDTLVTGNSAIRLSRRG